MMTALVMREGNPCYSKGRKLKEEVYFVGAIDWNRMIFDGIIPSPKCRTYNPYLIKKNCKKNVTDRCNRSHERENPHGEFDRLIIKKYERITPKGEM